MKDMIQASGVNFGHKGSYWVEGRWLVIEAFVDKLAGNSTS